MDWLDYREKLKIGFDDQEKFDFFLTKIFNILDDNNDGNIYQIGFSEYFDFCNMTGTVLNHNVSEGCEYQEVIDELHRHTASIRDFLSYYVAFVNCQIDNVGKEFKREEYINMLLRFLRESHLNYEILEDRDGYFVFPKGAKELDDSLVSDVLLWLGSYPNTHKTYVNALKQYEDGIYIRDVADNLRKTLESFLQEFLGNEKNLENNKIEICKFLGNRGVDNGVVGLFEPLIKSYKNINDRIAKHNDKVDKNLLEFLLYQTGVLIRMVLVIEMDENMI